MANVRAFRAGNWSDTNTTTSPWATGGVLYAPNSSDDVFTNGFTVTVDNSPTVVSVTNSPATSRAWKDGATTTAASGGGLILSNGQTLTATTGAFTAVVGNFIILNGTNSAAFVGNVLSAANSAYSIINLGSGTLTFTGYAEATGSNAGGIFRNQGAGGMIINGGLTSSGVLWGCYQDIGGNLIVNGYVTSNGLPSIVNGGVGTVTVVGTMTASNGGGNAIRSTNTASLVKASGSFICAADGTMAVAAIKMILNTTPIAAKTRYALNGTSTFVDMFTADNPGLAPAVGDVRAGVVYGSATGTCAVPAAGSVALGVPVDATTGTAALNVGDVATAVWSAATRTLTATAGITAADVWTHATRTITGGTVDTLTNAPSVPSAAAIASQVRSELSVELARVDENISSRLAAADYTAPSAAPSVTAIRQEMDANSTKLANLDASVSSRLAGASYTAPANSDITAIKVQTDALNTERLANVATTAIVGNLIAQANS